MEDLKYLHRKEHLITETSQINIEGFVIGCYKLTKRWVPNKLPNKTVKIVSECFKKIKFCVAEGEKSQTMVKMGSFAGNNV